MARAGIADIQADLDDGLRCLTQSSWAFDIRKWMKY
jgi:hypothetical protein